MLVASVIKKLLWAIRYPSFPSKLVGPYAVGAVQTRLPGSVACQIHYPAADASQSKEFHPYFRPEAVKGVGDYSKTDPGLMEFLSNRRHPCWINADPLVRPADQGDKSSSGFPIVVFSHGLGGCYEMYTQLCMEIASQGYCVVALEHEDGSGCYAEAADGTPIWYKRPDDTPYSRQKVTNFRRAFLQQRVKETLGALEYLSNCKTQDEMLQKILKTVDISNGCHLLGHSFGGASLIMTCREHRLSNGNSSQGMSSPKHQVDIKSLSVLDPWAFSLEDEVLEEGVQHMPLLSILSESWLTNPETAQVQELLGNTERGNVISLYAPDSVHASFADSKQQKATALLSLLTRPTHSKELMEAIRLAREREERVLVKDGRRVGDTSAGGGAEVGAKMEQQHQQPQQQQHTFTHLTPSGQSVSMVDVGSKQITRRIAVARSSVVFPPEVMEAFHLQGGESEEMVGPKGPIFASAKIAGIMGAKRTHELIPLCHPLPLDKVDVQISLHDNTAIIECECRVTHKTGVEMEALTGATVAALTIYDMCKAVSHNIAIGETVLVRKEGGKRTVRGQTLMK